MRDGDDTGEGASGIAAVGASLTGLGAALTATAASLCCIGPAVVSIVGVGGAVAAAGLKPYRPLLMMASLALIGLGLWFAYRPSIASSRVSACPSRAGRVSRIIVWVAAILWLMAILLPYLVGY
jgi:mercuric ion transport protein